jgi:uncharacterized repeat protein (TIGR03809 family)
MHESKFTSWQPKTFARKWHALAERRRKHLAELYEDGTWKRYYTEETLRARMREAAREVEHWSAAISEQASSAAESREARPTTHRAA